MSTQSLWSGAEEGWGITSIQKLLYVSDGTSDLTVVDSGTMATVDSLQVTENGSPLINLNELEYCSGDGLIYANIWYKDRVVAIDPSNGHVHNSIDFSTFASVERDYQRRVHGRDNSNVLNGIAYDSSTDTFFLTGKRWHLVFEVSLK